MKKTHWRLLSFIAFAALLLFALWPAQAQEAAPAIAPTEQRPPDRAAVESQRPSRANNWNLPTIIRYNDEEVTEGFWVISLCGKPVMVVYDTETQMALPIMGPPLIKLGAQKAWELEDGPPLLIMPDLAQVYAPLAEMCDFLAESNRRHYRENEKVTPPPTRMK
jgi:hypothetical protein